MVLKDKKEKLDLKVIMELKVLLVLMEHQVHKVLQQTEIKEPKAHKE